MCSHCSEHWDPPTGWPLAVVRLLTIHLGGGVELNPFGGIYGKQKSCLPLKSVIQIKYMLTSLREKIALIHQVELLDLVSSDFLKIVCSS